MTRARLMRAGRQAALQTSKPPTAPGMSSPCCPCAEVAAPFWMGVPVSSTRRRQLRLVSAEMVLLPCADFSLRRVPGCRWEVIGGTACYWMYCPHGKENQGVDQAPQRSMDQQHNLPQMHPWASAACFGPSACRQHAATPPSPLGATHPSPHSFPCSRLTCGPHRIPASRCSPPARLHACAASHS